jgi:hypothetical protein
MEVSHIIYLLSLVGFLANGLGWIWYHYHYSNYDGIILCTIAFLPAGIGGIGAGFNVSKLQQDQEIKPLLLVCIPVS